MLVTHVKNNTCLKPITPRSGPVYLHWITQPLFFEWQPICTVHHMSLACRSSIGRLLNSPGVMLSDWLSSFFIIIFLLQVTSKCDTGWSLSSRWESSLASANCVLHHRVWPGSSAGLLPNLRIGVPSSRVARALVLGSPQSSWSSCTALGSLPGRWGSTNGMVHSCV